MIVRGQPQNVVLLSTVLLDVVAADGTRHSIRALFDSGAQASFITEQTACVLMLKRHHSTVAISTFASSTTSPVRGQTTITVMPRGQQAPSFCVDTYIVPQITGPTPQAPIVPGQWKHIQNLSLADPLYHRPQAVDLLLGADILPMLLLNGKATGKPGEPIAFETVFGWILMGPVDKNAQSTVTAMCLSVSETLDLSIRRFWELEELPVVRHLSPDERAAEEIYKKTTTRLRTGRFMVSLPFRKASPLLGDSKSVALRRFQALENRLSNDPNLQRQYADFMQDYLDAGHMELVPLENKDNVFHYYIPHHCVLRPDSSTTKLRVVFNASSRTSAGCSLNESMYTGPKLQPDIQIVLLRARLWKYVFMTDIKQMYRQIVVRPADRDYLRIFWRFSKNTTVQEYRLCTVTYGTSAAPYQALRTIQELAIVDGKLFPIAASILLNDTFVDDILTGANTEKDALEYQSQLIQLCSLAKFELRKWASNNSHILHAVPVEAQAMSPALLYNDKNECELKILGLKWDPRADVFSFDTKPSKTEPTKRSVLSDIARVFDPLGLLSPITFWTKHVMQLLWTAGLKWDDKIPTDLAQLWTRYQSELKLIESISIPRRITVDDATTLQLHAFSDSSEKGYAAAVYLRTQTATSAYCHLVTGKSKVAPLKKSTIPRLELCGAVLAAKLLRFVADTYSKSLPIDELHAWTDSTTALAWIQSSPHRWATFVANRTSQIHELTSPDIWHHVPTQQNPVDCASRGLFPSELVDHPLWWTGPAFLVESPENWPSVVPRSDNTGAHVSTEARKCTVLQIKTTCSITDVLHRFSSFDKILHIVAYCLRFSKSRPSAFTQIVNASERERALLGLVYSVQQTSYSEDISSLKNGLRCSPAIRKLDPFIDESGLLRVGGRLTNADLPYSHKHPLLLPCQHRLTLLLIDYHHQRLKHPGCVSLQAHLQREYWIPSVRKIIRSRIRLCISCFRTRPRAVQPKMASLPSFRVQQVKPFAITGVDYAGPVTLKEARGRRSVPKTAYICLFVCTTTKALHLELSSDLSTECFLMAFTRFSARRGPIKELHSDCGTNFVGASRLLTPLHEFTHSKDFQDSVHHHLAKHQITWHFNPPASPHFGGLWEAGVKSAKSLILRSIGLHKLTSEEFLTLLTQIEATLNSRPLCAISNDPGDLEALTPSHFLTLEPSTSLPEPSLVNQPMSKYQRWRLIADLHRHFWTRWKNEYLSSLQLRRKWTEPGQELRIGELVLVKEATHPLRWRIGRIRELHPGSDGTSRVATVETTSGPLTRPAVKLCPLPMS